MCNKCQQRAFTSIGHLNAHLAICGKQSKEQCGICGKMYSTKGTLFTHIQEVHKEGHSRKCPFCDEKVYTSEGGYYKPMHVKHQISRNTIKLSEYMKAQDTENNVNEDNDDEQKDNSDSDKKKKKPKNKMKKKDKDEKSENTANTSQPQSSKRKKEVGSEDTDDGKPKRKRIKLETDNGGKKSTEVLEDNEITNKKATPRKRKASEISEGVKSDPAKSNKGNSYPAKRT